jgi:hypothetical protein
MSFSFYAAGSKAQVTAKLRAIADGRRNISTGGLGTGIARLLAEHISQDHDHPGGDEYVYIVTASGHSGGGSATSLNVSVAPHWIEPFAEESENAAEGIASEEPDRETIP